VVGTNTAASSTPGVLVVQHPRDEADRLGVAMREIDQHHALRPLGLGLQDVEQLACTAVDGIGQRYARDAALHAADQALPDDAVRQHADRDDGDQGGDQRDAGLRPGIIEPSQRLRKRGGNALRQWPDPGLADVRQQPEHETEHHPGEPDRQQGEQA
jgi:hypothetical protein